VFGDSRLGFWVIGFGLWAWISFFGIRGLDLWFGFWGFKVNRVWALGVGPGGFVAPVLCFPVSRM